MKIAKSGHYKNKGLTTLANVDVKPGRTTGFQVGAPFWRPEPWDLFLRVKGIERQTTYDYDLHLSGDELAIMVENALIGASNETAVHAQAKAIGGFIREVLNPKRKETKKA